MSVAAPGAMMVIVTGRGFAVGATSGAACLSEAAANSWPTASTAGAALDPGSSGAARSVALTFPLAFPPVQEVDRRATQFVLSAPFGEASPQHADQLVRRQSTAREADPAVLPRLVESLAAGARAQRLSCRLDGRMQQPATDHRQRAEAHPAAG